MTTTVYLWDIENDNVLSEAEDEETPKTFTTEPKQDGGLVSQKRAGTNHWYHFDAIGNTSDLTIGSEVVSDTWIYNVFGVVEGHVGSAQTSFLFFAQSGFIADTKYYLSVGRIYQSRIGRWANASSLSIASYPFSVVDENEKTEPNRIKVDLVKNPPPQQPTCKPSRGIVRWSFSLEQSAPCNGFFVQEVRVNLTEVPCDEKLSEGKPLNFSYWEAWRVKKGKFRSSLSTSKDRASFLPKVCTKGHYDQRGEIRFYCNSDLGIDPKEEGDSIPGWDPYGRPPVFYPPGVPLDQQTTAGNLTSIGTKPPWWNHGPVGILDGAAINARRSLIGDWTCCPKKKDCCGDGTNIATMWHIP